MTDSKKKPSAAAMRAVYLNQEMISTRQMALNVDAQFSPLVDAAQLVVLQCEYWSGAQRRCEYCNGADKETPNYVRHGNSCPVTALLDGLAAVEGKEIVRTRGKGKR